MKYKEFVDWCDERAEDGCWGSIEAMACINIIGVIQKLPFWRREKFWKKIYEDHVVKEIVQPINNMIRERKEG